MLFYLSKQRNCGGGRGNIALEMLLSCLWAVVHLVLGVPVIFSVMRLAGWAEGCPFLERECEAWGTWMLSSPLGSAGVSHEPLQHYAHIVMLGFERSVLRLKNKKRQYFATEKMLHWSMGILQSAFQISAEKHFRQECVAQPSCPFVTWLQSFGPHRNATKMLPHPRLLVGSEVLSWQKMKSEIWSMPDSAASRTGPHKSLVCDAMGYAIFLSKDIGGFVSDCFIEQTFP